MRVGEPPQLELEVLPAGAFTARPISPPMREFLAWVARRPRTYGETMAAWRTSCPRYSIWEDALGDGLVCLAGDATTMDQTPVRLTPSGSAILDRD